MKYRLAELMDITKLLELLESFYALTEIPSAILEVDGTILCAVGWQDICTKYHRVCPETEQNCRESDNYIAQHLNKGPYIGYKCKNGMQDFACPIIIEGHHVGTLFTGQVFSQPPDQEFFIQQAKKNGFNEEAYLEALRKVPVFPENKMKSILDFFEYLGNMLTSMGLQRLKQLQTMEEIKKSEGRLIDIINFLPDPTFAINLEGKVIVWNQALEEMTGIKAIDILGKGNYEYAIPLYGIRRAILIDLVLQPDDNIEKKYAFLKKTKEKILTGEAFCPAIGKIGIFVLAKASPLYDADGKLIGAIETFRDITEQKQSEEALHAERNQLLSIFDSINEIIYVADPKTHEILYANQATKNIFNKKLEGGICYRELQGLEAPCEFCINQIIFSEKDKSYLWEYHNPTVNKDFFIVDRVIKWHNGLDVRFEFAIDITEQKQAELKLNYQKHSFESLFKNTTEAIAFLDNNQKIIDINESFTKLFGYKLEEIKGKYLYEVLSAGKVLTECQDSCQKMSRGEPTSTDTVRYSKYKKPIDVNFKSVPVIIDGNIVGGYGIFTDITNRKRYEEKLIYLSMIDAHTGLYNRRYFEEILGHLNNEAQLPLSIIMGDVNGLKLVNDVFGHQAGDKLLVKVAKIFNEKCRIKDVICRIGGDEFAIILPSTREKIAEQVCDNIMKACNKLNEEPIPFSISLGVATKNDIKQNIQKIIKEAEDRMYRHKLLESKSSRSFVIASLKKTLWEKTNETEEHSERLSKLATQFGKAIGLSGSELDELELLATLHDIGKVAIPEQILFKPGRLTQEEWEIMKKHSEIGYRIAQTTPELVLIAEKILAHHEHWDGRGYPQGLKGEDIPLTARILTLVDAFDVMTNERPYKKPVSQQDALKELSRCDGTQFDPHLVKIFIEIITGKKVKTG